MTTRRSDVIRSSRFARLGRLSRVLVPACALLTACAVAPDAESTASNEAPLKKKPICTVDSDDPACTNSSGNPPLPDVTYLTAAPSETGVRVSFYTPSAFVVVTVRPSRS